MKQIIQSFKTGETILEEVPAPQVKRGSVLIQTTYSLVSLGTEKMLVEFGKSNLLSKARQQPDKVKQVLDKISTEGLLPTLEAVFNKLGEPLPLGYCHVGRVIAVGEGVSDFKVGDRVASNGQHAEFVCIPKNLVAHIPDNVTDEEATFTVIGAIGLQGIRLANPTMGEAIVVVGLGLIGLITAQLLMANGCQVIGSDVDETKLALARSWGIRTFNPAQAGDIIKFVTDATEGVGADAVIITASSRGDELIAQAAKMSRKRGRIVLVGVVGLNISRADFYEKELSFQVSCSYGPGRYDENYEQNGIDYPLPYVRWTEKRNFETILRAISTGRLNVKEIISEVVPLPEYNNIYGVIGASKSIASLLKYEQAANPTPQKTIVLNTASFTGAKGVVGVIGAGNFSKMTMLPALKHTPAHFKYIASNGGVTGTALAKKYGFTHSTTDYHEILADEDVDLVMITTRHNLHAPMVTASLNAGKHVFVEKPLALNTAELEQVIESYQRASDLGSQPTLSVGFNRRFSPHIQQIKKRIGNAPMNIIATMNAGFIPPNVWVHDMKIGGGRIIGEACHFIDLITYLTGSTVKSVCMNAMGNNPEEHSDNATILLKYKNGSTGTVHYFANGAKAYQKERLEVYVQEKTYIMNNFIHTEAFGDRGFSKLKTRLDKGHANQFKLLINSVQNGGSPLIPLNEIVNTTLASFAAVRSLKNSKWIEV